MRRANALDVEQPVHAAHGAEVVLQALGRVAVNVARGRHPAPAHVVRDRAEARAVHVGGRVVAREVARAVVHALVVVVDVVVPGGAGRARSPPARPVGGGTWEEEE